MSKNWTYKPGDWWAICDSCGRKFKASQLRKRWDGLMVCSEDWNPRQSLDFVRPNPDKITVPWTRPRPADVFIPVTYNERLYENVSIEDTVTTAADFNRYIGQVLFPTDADVVNGSYLNLLAVNASSIDAAPPSNPETISLSEAISSSVGFNVALTDSVALSETITEIEGEFSIDSVSISESVNIFAVTNRLLNAHKPNEVTIG